MDLDTLARDEFAGLDPFDLMDTEAARIDTFLTGLTDDDWTAPTPCDGWDRRALLAHLAGSEDYNQACLDGRLDDFLATIGAAGVTDVASFNAYGIDQRSDRTPAELLEEWRAACGDTRRRMAERRGGELPTMVGPYPVDWQACHLAAELATHADDLGVPITPAEAAERADWRTRIARFMAAEHQPDLTVVRTPDGTQVTIGDTTATLDDATFLSLVTGRGSGTDLDPAITAALDPRV
jgi:uncharacterized protein (TIGR03083 family)